MAVGRSRMAVVALAVALGVLVRPARWRAIPAMDAGGLRADVRADPWRLSFTDKGGNDVLVEAPGTGTGEIGALGFRTDDGWFRATRVLSGSGSTDSYTAELETTDPVDRTIAVILDTSQGGVISLAAEVKGPALGDVTATGISFAPGNERYLGFGERSNAVDQRGNVVENYVSDGPWQLDQYSIGEALPLVGIPSPRRRHLLPDPVAALDRRLRRASRQPRDELLQPRPGRRVERRGRHRRPRRGAPASSPPPTHLQMRSPRRPGPADVLRRFTKATGRQDRAAAPWSLGPWVQPTGDVDEQLGILGQLQERTRRCRSRRPISITCRAATSRAGVPRSAPAPRRCTTSASRSRPISTR